MYVVLIEISQGIKTFDLFKSIIRKPFEKIRFQNTILCYFKSYASILVKENDNKINYI
jgi:hypothetical protein